MTAFMGADPSNTFTAATLLSSGKSFGLGDRYVDFAGNEWVFVQANTALPQYGIATISAGYIASALSLTNDARGNNVGASQTAFNANEYGWLLVKGVGQVQVIASCAANTRLNTTGTAGFLDDDGTAGSMQVQSVYLTTARVGSNGPAPAVLSYPYIDVTL